MCYNYLFLLFSFPLNSFADLEDHKKQLVVVAGATHRYNHVEGQVFMVLEMFWHKDFNRSKTGYADDIALIKINGRFTFNDKVQKIELAVDPKLAAFSR